MTRKDALLEARKRWGARASVRKTSYKIHANLTVTPVKPYVVSSKVVVTVGTIWGVGESWEAAFEHAEQRRQAFGL